jgi:hypothetical protein
MDWYYKSEVFNPNEPINHYGFIYKIIFEDGEGKLYSYYGKKSLYRKKTMPPLKGYKRKRVSMIESNWRLYTGSTDASKNMIPISKEILMFADSKNHLSYSEAKVLFDNEVLFSDDCLNANIMGKYFDNVNRRAGEWIKWYDKMIIEKEE